MITDAITAYLSLAGDIVVRLAHIDGRSLYEAENVKL